METRTTLTHTGRSLLGGAFLAAIFACGGGTGGDSGPEASPLDSGTETENDSAAPDTPEDAGPSRSFFLSSTGAQFFVTPTYRNDQTTANLATDVDVTSIINDFHGLPWHAFENDTEPPSEWIAVMNRLALGASDLGKPIFLSLQIVGGDKRHFLADDAVVENGSVTTVQGWSSECYDFATATDASSKIAAYVRYVEWMIDRFDPVYLNVGLEMNLFMDCGAAWDGLVEVERAAYDAAKSANPELIVFPSIQIDALYGHHEDHCPVGQSRDACFENNYARLERLKPDRFAISTYPSFLIEDLNGSLPEDWFTRAAERGNERAIVAETGWVATPIVGDLRGTCVTALDSSPAAQVAYFDQLTEAAETHGMDLVTWFSNRDVVDARFVTDCPCTFDGSWCFLNDALRAAQGTDPTAQFYGEVFGKIFGTMGLRDYYGEPRPEFFAHWEALRGLPVRSEL